MISFQIRNLYIAKNYKIDNKSVTLIVNDLGYNKSGYLNNTTAEVTNKNLLDKLKWMVIEYDNLRI
ncbi:hypothetical protein [Candidatus Nitrosocosmicus hydrocola]|uniref:hypothetical protein n=1 Tax=Candidatus Nitrosocosmicus hydrocola TaxID=1826872 RepID=UPI0011E5A5A2|nr:hypothetical protein [Candidatus Nitrosocosmicus hydrocola]